MSKPTKSVKGVTLEDSEVDRLVIEALEVWNRQGDSEMSGDRIAWAIRADREPQPGLTLAGALYGVPGEVVTRFVNGTALAGDGADEALATAFTGIAADMPAPEPA